eukprot:312827_1
MFVCTHYMVHKQRHYPHTGLYRRSIMFACCSSNFYYQNNVDFYVNCTYDGTGTECAWSTIHCPLYAGCFITCNSYKACIGTRVNWVQSQQFNLSCIGNDCLQLNADTNTSTT